MPYIITTPQGLKCLLCAAASHTKAGQKWKDGTASPTRKLGEAQQHCASGKHLEAFQEAKSIPSVSHLLPGAEIHKWVHAGSKGTKCNICAQGLESRGRSLHPGFWGTGHETGQILRPMLAQGNIWPAYPHPPSPLHVLTHPPTGRPGVGCPRPSNGQY